MDVSRNPCRLQLRCAWKQSVRDRWVGYQARGPRLVRIVQVATRLEIARRPRLVKYHVARVGSTSAPSNKASDENAVRALRGLHVDHSV